jgi:hypothetical protein
VGKGAGERVGFGPGEVGEQDREALAEQSACGAEYTLAVGGQAQLDAPAVFGQLTSLHQSRVDEAGEQLRDGRA